jgi:hypothetical protein
MSVFVWSLRSVFIFFPMAGLLQRKLWWRSFALEAPGALVSAQREQHSAETNAQASRFLFFKETIYSSNLTGMFQSFMKSATERETFFTATIFDFF